MVDSFEFKPTIVFFCSITMKTFIQSIVSAALSLSLLGSCAQPSNKQKNMTENKTTDKPGLEIATFGTGCFWCTEAVFLSLDGVESVVSGYAGGRNANPTYKEVCSGLTGHAECVEIKFDPKKITYLDLLQAFFRAHDPTTLNRQGADAGTQYRSVIYYHNDEQKRLANEVKKELDASGAYSGPIVTEISQAPVFYVAEAYHQNYFANNPDQSYCAYVIAPKLDKFRKVFKDKLKAH